MDTMFPSQQQIGVLNGYLGTALRFQGTEFELRFSTFARDLYVHGQPADPTYKPNNYRFVPIIDQGVFHRALTTFQTYGLPERRERVTDVLFNNYVRQTVDEQGHVTWLTKTRSQHTDFYDYNVRASCATEVPHPGLPPDSTPDHVRVKDRTSFRDRCVRYDFTIVTSQDLRYENRPQKTSYEIEIEFISEAHLGITQEQSLHHILFCMCHMLRTLQGSPTILPLSVKHNLLLEYSTLTRQYYFLGAQPETLHRHHLNRLRSGVWAISEKYDGERYLLFVSDDGYSYLLDRRMQVKRASLPQSASERGTVLDIEFCNDIIYAFDIVFHRGRDLRDDRALTLPARIKLLEKVINTFKACQDPKRDRPRKDVKTQVATPIFVKKHHFVNEFDALFTRWKNDTYDDKVPRDGFIFTPLTEPYPSKPKWTNLLKWKPADMNSIDFQIEEVQDEPGLEQHKGKTYHLLVGDKDNRNVIFDPCPAIFVSEGDPWQQQLRNGVILECTYDNNGGVAPWRLREDKRKPNFRHVALDVWKSMHEPVHIEDLERRPLHNMRQYHNRVKEHVIRKAAALCLPEPTQSNKGTSTLHVLDLACGRGGDLHKWAKTGCDNYMGIDISDELLAEAKSRARDMKTKYPRFHPDFQHADLRHEPIVYDMGHRTSDIVSCQFALHYFYETEEAFNNFSGVIKRTLRPGGVFIASLFDGYRVFDLCARGDNEQTSNSVGFKVQPGFDVRMGIANVKNKEFGIPISVWISGDDDVILKTPTTEFLVFPDLFILRMARLGFHLVETRRFPDVQLEARHAKDGNPDDPQLAQSDMESAYTDLHRFYIFVYKPCLMEGQSATIDQEILSLTNWQEFDLSCFGSLEPETLANILLDGQDPPQHHKLFTRIVNGADPSEHSWITFYLDLITGKAPLAEDPISVIDFAGLAEHYNVFITILNATKDLTVTIDTYRPTAFLEDVKQIYFLKKRIDSGTAHHHLIARECAETQQKLLWFPSRFAIPEEANPTIEPAAVVPIATAESVQTGSTPLIESFPLHEAKLFTIKELQQFAKEKEVKIPSNLKKKSEMAEYVRTQLQANQSQSSSQSI